VAPGRRSIHRREKNAGADTGVAGPQALASTPGFAATKGDIAIKRPPEAPGNDSPLPGKVHRGAV